MGGLGGRQNCTSATVRREHAGCEMCLRFLQAPAVVLHVAQTHLTDGLRLAAE